MWYAIILLVILVLPVRGGEAARPATMIFHRETEARERAFTVLVPKGWCLAGGIVRVDPNRAGGVLNAIEAKCDLSISSDAAGTVQLRRLPKITYAQPGISPLHGPGSVYNGAQVLALPPVDEYLRRTLAVLRPQAEGLTVIQCEPLPQLASAVQQMCGPVNQSLAAVGVAGIAIQAGFLVAEYREGGRPCKELVYTILADVRGAKLWSNDLTTAMRCPAGEVERWRPVFDIIANSVRMDAAWMQREAQGQREGAETARRLQEDLARLDRDITSHRRATQEAIQTDQFLTVMGKDDYRNPFTQEVERDTAAWSRRWVNAAGDCIFSDDGSYDPNADPGLPRQGFQLTRAVRR